MLPPVATVTIVHAFGEYCGGRGGGGADFAASAAPYIFNFHLVMGCGWPGWLPRGLAPGGAAGGVPRGRGQDGKHGGGRADGRGSGGGANNGGGNGEAFPAVSLLTLETMSWRRGGRWCLGIVGPASNTKSRISFSFAAIIKKWVVCQNVVTWRI